MLRVLTVLGGLAGAGTLSQFPEFSQQYLQRLGGQLDALTAVTTDFDASATASGLTRDAALAALSGSAFLDLRRTDMTRVFARHATVAADYALLSAAAPLERLALPHRFRDTETLNATWAEFQTRRADYHGRAGRGRDRLWHRLAWPVDAVRPFLAPVSASRGLIPWSRRDCQA